MRVLVTGACGYLGRGIVGDLLNRGHYVTLAYLHGEPPAHERARSVRGDILGELDLQRIYGPQDVVLHLAWHDGFNHRSETHMKELPRHCAFVDRVTYAGYPRLLVMGSMHEVGRHVGAVTDITPCWPQSPYGIAKNALRDYSFAATEKSNCCVQWLRGYYIVSAEEAGNSIFSKLYRATLAGQGEFPFTSGSNECDFLDYGDFCSLVCDVVESGPAPGIFNVASGVPESLASRVERFICENNLDIRLDYGAFPDRPYDSPSIWGDMEQTRALIGQGSKGAA